jgi:hypothetical protein
MDLSLSASVHSSLLLHDDVEARTLKMRILINQSMNFSEGIERSPAAVDEEFKLADHNNENKTMMLL